MRDTGFEPVTPSVSRKCSTTELTARPVGTPNGSPEYAGGCRFSPAEFFDVGCYDFLLAITVYAFLLWVWSQWKHALRKVSMWMSCALNPACSKSCRIRQALSVFQ